LWTNLSVVAKTAILPVSHSAIQQSIPFKKYILLFDKLLIEQKSFDIAMSLLSIADKLGAKTQRENIRNNQQEIEYLLKKDILQFDKIGRKPSIVSEPTSEDFQFMEAEAFKMTEILEKFDPENISPKSISDFIDGTMNLYTSFARVLSIIVRTEGVDAYPLFSEEPEYLIGNKTEVLKFVLSEVPEPSDSTSWEQILDFRSDPDSLRKYYALINWTNEVASNKMTRHELEEKYLALYHEYSEQFRIHKMKSNLTTLELIVTSGIDFITNGLGVGNISTTLFSIFKKNMNLLESELKFSGKEIAYIYKTRQVFKP
jgi:hypothetical protein